MSFVVGGRARLVIDDGPFAGVEAECDAITGWPVYAATLALVAAYSHAEGEALIGPIKKLYEFVEPNARLTWNLVDPRGPVPPTVGGMLRLPVPLMFQLIDLWTETYAESTPEE